MVKGPKVPTHILYDADRETILITVSGNFPFLDAVPHDPRQRRVNADTVRAILSSRLEARTEREQTWRSCLSVHCVSAASSPDAYRVVKVDPGSDGEDAIVLVPEAEVLHRATESLKRSQSHTMTLDDLEAIRRDVAASLFVQVPVVVRDRARGVLFVTFVRPGDLVGPPPHEPLRASLQARLNESVDGPPSWETVESVTRLDWDAELGEYMADVRLVKSL
jgi:hypothetical protein